MCAWEWKSKNCWKGRFCRQKTIKLTSRMVSYQLDSTTRMSIQYFLYSKINVVTRCDHTAPLIYSLKCVKVHTNLVSKHALKPVLPCSWQVNSKCWSTSLHHHYCLGQKLIRETYNHLVTELEITVPLLFGKTLVPRHLNSGIHTPHRHSPPSVGTCE